MSRTKIRELHVDCASGLFGSGLGARRPYQNSGGGSLPSSVQIKAKSLFSIFFSYYVYTRKYSPPFQPGALPLLQDGDDIPNSTSLFSQNNRCNVLTYGFDIIESPSRPVLIELRRRVGTETK